MKKEFKKELIAHIKNVSATSKELRDSLDEFIKIQQMKSMDNMHIIVSVSHNYRNDAKYYAAKTFFPIGIDEEKEFRVYIGKLELFKDGAKDEELLRIAKRKLLLLINNHLRGGLVEN